MPRSLSACGLLLQPLAACLPHHCEPPEEVVPELDDFVPLLLDVGGVAVVGDLDDSRCSWWLQESLLELDLLEEELVGLMRRQLVLLLDGQEVGGGDGLAGVGDEVLDELGGGRSCCGRQVERVGGAHPEVARLVGDARLRRPVADGGEQVLLTVLPSAGPSSEAEGQRVGALRPPSGALGPRVVRHGGRVGARMPRSGALAAPEDGARVPLALPLAVAVFHYGIVAACRVHSVALAA